MFGLPTFAAREAARGRPVGTLVLSLGAVLIGLGALVFLVGIPVSSLLAEDRSVVRTFLIVGFAFIPIALLGALLTDICSGLERWRLVIAARIIPVSIMLVSLVVLFAAGLLTVGSAAVVYISTAVTTILVVSPVLRHRRFRFDLRVVKEGISFGARAWVRGTADLANARLDQLLMITLVTPQKLGLYVVAASVGMFGLFITGGISPPLLTRISAGEVELAPRALRTVLALLALLSVMVAAVTPFLLPLLFGSAFADAVDPALVLLAAGIPLGGGVILTSALDGLGRPGLPAIGQVAALLITIPGVLLLVPLIGIMGAAVVSLIAYTASFLIMLVAMTRTSEVTISELLVPTGGDIVWLREFVRSRIPGRRRGTDELDHS